MNRDAERDFVAFVESRSHALFRTAMGLTGQRQQAEDLLQTVLAKAYRRWSEVRDSPEAYLRTAMYRQQVSWWRRPGHGREIATAVLPERAGADQTRPVESAGDESEPDRVLGIRFYDLDGKPVRTLGLDDGALLNAAGFSPDGSAMALGRRNGGDVTVVDSTDGTVRARVPLAEPGPVVVGWYDDSHLVLRSYADVDEWRQLIVVDLAGRRMRTVPLDGTWADAGRVTLGPAEGLSPAAAGLAF
jgi:hypothetical protein